MKVGTKEDNLIAIYRTCCFGWLSEKHTIWFLLSQYLIFQSIPVSACIEFFCNGTFHANRKYYPLLIVLQMGSLMFLVALAGYSDIGNTPEIFKMHTWSWEIAGDKIYRKLLLEGRHLKVVCYAIFCLTTVSALLLPMPVFGDEKQWEFVQFLWDKYFEDRMFFLLLIFLAMEAVFLGIFISSLTCFSLYCIGHIWVQYQLLNAYVCRLHARSIYHINDIRYQERVNVLLISCIKMHTEIMNFFRRLKTILMKRATPLIISFTFYGLTIFVFSGYFIMTGISPRNNFRMYTSMLTSCFILWSFCEYCQRVTNESEKVFVNACRCPWEQFNNTNRRTLLMLISNTINPVTISCHGVLDANYPLAVKMWRMAYATYTLLTNMSQDISRR